MVAVTRWDLVRVFWRSLWLQASWSYRDMQSLGFAYALEPVLRRRYQGEELCVATGRHLEFFNSNPILAAAIVGAAVHAEMQGGGDATEAACRVRNALMGPYGAIGDSFFWGAAKPCAALIALLVAVSGSLWAPWLLVGLFGAINIGARGLFFTLGVRRGAGVAEVIQGLDLLRWAAHLKAVAAVLAGVFVVAAVSPERWSSVGVPTILAWTGAVLGAMAGALVMRRCGGPTALLASVTAVALGAVWLT